MFLILNLFFSPLDWRTGTYTWLVVKQTSRGLSYIIIRPLVITYSYHTLTCVNCTRQSLDTHKVSTVSVFNRISPDYAKALFLIFTYGAEILTVKGFINFMCEFLPFPFWKYTQKMKKKRYLDEWWEYNILFSSMFNAIIFCHRICGNDTILLHLNATIF